MLTILLAQHNWCSPLIVIPNRDIIVNDGGELTSLGLGGCSIIIIVR